MMCGITVLNSLPPVCKPHIYTVNAIVLFHFAGVSGKDGAIQLASKALMKKRTTRSLHYKGNAIIETAPEMDEILQKVKKYMQTLCKTELKKHYSKTIE